MAGLFDACAVGLRGGAKRSTADCRSAPASWMRRPRCHVPARLSFLIHMTVALKAVPEVGGPSSTATVWPERAVGRRAVQMRMPRRERSRTSPREQRRPATRRRAVSRRVEAESRQGRIAARFILRWSDGGAGRLMAAGP